MQNGGMMTMPLAEYTTHKDFYDQYANYGGLITTNEQDKTVQILFSCAVKVYCRIITKDHTPKTEAQVVSFLQEALSRIHATGLSVSNIVPYSKLPDQGEINCQFRSSTSLREIQQLFADAWQGDVADHRQSTIHCPGAVFLWITT